MKTLIHSITSAEVMRFIAEPSHALLLEGPVGVGKGSLATYIGASLLGLDEERLEGSGYVLRLIPQTSHIPIETIRELQHFLQLKTPGRKALRRLIIIEQADRLTREAQNAFLKILEEPPSDTLILLTSAHTADLLPTIRSRVQRISVKPLDKATLIKHFEALGFSEAEITRASYISEGRVGLMQAILAHETTHPLALQIEVAKQLLIEPTFNRLVRVDDLTKQKTSMPELLQALALVCSAALRQASEKDDLKLVKRWHVRLKRLAKAEQNFEHSPNTKLFLTDLLLNL